MNELPDESQPRAGKQRPQLSIVVPVYFNEASLPSTIPELARVARGIAGEAFELVFVDDGSRDQSFAVLEEHQRDPTSHLRIVKFTRNFGSMVAIQAGLAAARGAAVGIIAADLQDPPELFTEMHAKWREGIKCIYAVRANRDEGRLKKFLANTFYAVLRRYALPGYPRAALISALLTVRWWTTSRG